MADGLSVSGGGQTRVATAELLAQAQDLREFAAVIDGCRSRLASVDAIVTPAQLVAADAPMSAMRAERALDDADAALRVTGIEARLLAESLDLVAETYGVAERTVGSLARALSARIAYTLGMLAPVTAAMLTPFAIGTAAVLALTPAGRRRQLAEWLSENNEALTDPLFVEFVRLAVMSADEFGGGLAHLPPPLVHLLGEEALGVLGLSTSAGVVAGVAGGVGLLRETPVTVSKRATMNHFPPPQTYEDRAGRIPTHSAQIRIDRYEFVGRPDRFDVYLGGTKDGSLVTRAEPFDNTSNVHAMALGDAGSYRAVAQAMERAGVSADTPVQFTGYSQGALLAAQLADSGDYDVRGVLTLGGPNGGQPAPAVNHVAVVHNDDVVTALGGPQQNTNVLEVRRTVFEGRQVPGDTLLPAHELWRYRQTAALLDASRENSIVAAGDSLRDFSQNASAVETTTWLARRRR